MVWLSVEGDLRIFYVAKHWSTSDVMHCCARFIGILISYRRVGGTVYRLIYILCSTSSPYYIGRTPLIFLIHCRKHVQSAFLAARDAPTCLFAAHVILTDIPMFDSSNTLWQFSERRTLTEIVTALASPHNTPASYILISFSSHSSPITCRSYPRVISTNDSSHHKRRDLRPNR